MQINVTCTLNYDQKIMEQTRLTDEEFLELVKQHALIDFNGGAEFDTHNMDFEIK
tara:strand:- start:78 stop:242 length:165 start_codon:yes stop_codon:yes gene_type:complete